MIRETEMRQRDRDSKKTKRQGEDGIDRKMREERQQIESRRDTPAMPVEAQCLNSREP